MERTLLTEGLDRRNFLKALGIGVGAAALGDLPWAHAQTGKEIIIGKASPSHPIYDLARYYAREKILKPEGIALNEKMFKGFVPSFAAIVNGNADFSYQTLVSLTRGIKKKFPVKGFLGYAQQFVYYMIAAPDIHNLDELVSKIKQGVKSGKKVKMLSHTPSSQAHMTINRVLRVKGVDPKTEVEISFVPSTPKRVAAMKAKIVDATVIFASRAIESSMRGEFNIVAKMPDFAPKQALNIWVATEETINKRPEVVQLFTNAMLRSYREMYKRDLDELAEFATSLKPWKKFNPAKAVRETIKEAREMELWPVNGGVARENIIAAQKFLVETKFMKSDNVLPVERLVTPKFQERALKELGPA